MGLTNWFTVQFDQPPKLPLALTIMAVQGSIQAFVYLVGMNLFSRSTPVEMLPFLRAFSLMGSSHGCRDGGQRVLAQGTSAVRQG